jgi:uncharacterized cupin superfamily protein
MTDLTVKEMGDFDSVFHGGMRRVRAGLGVTSFGIQVIELPAGFTGYPQHDHSHDDQEEVYLPLSGRVTLEVGDQSVELAPGIFARVGPGEKRKLITGDEPAQVLCVGGTPGSVYEPPDWTEEGGRTPLMGEHGEDKKSLA